MTSFAASDPRVRFNLNPLAKVYSNPAELQEQGAGALALLKASFQLENMLVSPFVNDRPVGEVEEGFDVFETLDPTREFHPRSNPLMHIQGYEQFADRFVSLRSRADVNVVKGNIDRELKNRAIIEEAGAMGFATMMLAAILDPLLLVPGIGVAKSALKGASVARTSARFAAVGGGFVTTQELVLQATQETRSALQTSVAIAGGTILSGVLGATIGSMSAKAFSKASRQMDDLVLVLGPAEAPASRAAEDVVEATARVIGAGSVPNEGLRVALIGADGKLYIGKKGDLHGHLSMEHGANIRSQQNLAAGEPTFLATGFVGPDGKFLGRRAALEVLPEAQRLKLRQLKAEELEGTLLRESQTGLLALATEAGKRIAKARFRLLGKDPNTGKPRVQLINDPLGPGGFDVPPMGSTTTLGEFAAAAGKDLPIKRARAFMHLAKWLSPRLQIPMSVRPIVRQIGGWLLMSPVRREGGAVALDAETAVRVHLARSRLSIRNKNDLYAQYRSGNPQARASITQQTFGFRGREGFMTQVEFDREIVRAMRGEAGPDGKIINVDTHEIPEIQQGAQMLRKDVINPFRDALIELGVLPKEILERPGYLTRLYNTELLRSVRRVKGKPDQFHEQEAFIDAIVSYQQKLAMAGGTISEFNEKAVRASMRGVLGKLMKLSDGRMFPGDVPFRGPLMDRTLDVPDAIIERWLSNDLDRILSYYTRSMAADLSLIERFGLVRARTQIEATHTDLVSRMRSVETANEAMRILRERDQEVIGPFGGRVLRKAMQAGRRNLAKKIHGSEDAADALTALKARDEKLMMDFSTANMKLPIDQINDAYRPLIREASKRSRREAFKLRTQRNKDIRNIRMARDDIRGLLQIPADPTQLVPRLIRSVRQMTLMALGGTIALASIPDLALPILNYGLGRAFRVSTATFTGGLKSLRLGALDAKLALGPSEVVANSRALRLFDFEDEFFPRTRIERGMDTATHAFSLANLMAPWNQVMRNWGALMVHSFVIENAGIIAKGGAIKAATRARLDELGLDDAILRKIAGQFNAHGAAEGLRRSWAPNIGEWTDADASLAFRAAVHRSMDKTLLRGSPLDRPFLPGANVPGIGPELSKALFMFLNFGLAANTRILGRSLQYRDSTILSGVLLTVGLGMLSVSLKRAAAGRDQPDTMADWIVRGVEQSGITGFLFDADNYLMAATNGSFGLGAALGARDIGGRYFSPRDQARALFGAAGGQVLEVAQTIPHFFDADPSPADIHRLRRLMILQNHFALRRLFDAIEKPIQKSVREGD